MTVLRRRFVPAPPTTPTPKRRRRRRARIEPAPPASIMPTLVDTPGMLGDMLDIVVPTIRRLAHAKLTAIITYVDTTGVRTEREVEPYREWGSGGGNVILTAWCRTQGKVRSFDLSRVERIREGQPFEPRGDISVPPPDDPDDDAEDPDR